MEERRCNFQRTIVFTFNHNKTSRNTTAREDKVFVSGGFELKVVGRLVAGGGDQGHECSVRGWGGGDEGRCSRDGHRPTHTYQYQLLFGIVDSPDCPSWP